jgi:hypothetical protein
MGFFFDQGRDRLLLRISLYRSLGTAKSASLLDQGLRVLVLLDYTEGGIKQLPAAVSGYALSACDRAIELSESGGRIKANILDPALDDKETALIRCTIGPDRWSSLEATLGLPGAKELNSIQFLGVGARKLNFRNRRHTRWLRYNRDPSSPRRLTSRSWPAYACWPTGGFNVRQS